MNDFLRTIAIIAVMAGFSSAACKEANAQDIENDLDNLLSMGKELGRKFHQVNKSSCDENLLTIFYEEFGNMVSEFKYKKQIDTISDSFSEEALTFDDPESDTLSCVEARMCAILSDDPSAVNDVDAAICIVIDKYRRKYGKEAAERFCNIYEYSNAGAFLGNEFATAMRDNDLSTAKSIENKVSEFSSGLSDTTYLSNAFTTAFNRFSSMAS